MKGVQMQGKQKVTAARRTKPNQVFFNLAEQILRFGLNSEPSSANVVAKRLHMKETPKNVGAVRGVLEKLIREEKVYKIGSRYAIDYRGGRNLMESFCIRISDENYKINDFVFKNIA
jgi:hypothetical protein